MIVNDYRKNIRGTNQYRAKRSWTQSTFLNLLFIPLVFGSIIAVKDVSKLAVAPTHADYVSPLPQYPEVILPQEKVSVRLHPTDSSWEGFKEMVRQLAPLYDFPVNVALSQAAIESNRGHSEFATARNNFFGIAAYDYDPNEAWSFDNQAHCIITYFHIVKKNFPTAYADRHNADKMIREMEDTDVDGVQYATDPDYVSKVESLAEWESK